LAIVAVVIVRRIRGVVVNFQFVFVLCGAACKQNPAENANKRRLREVKRPKSQKEMLFCRPKPPGQHTTATTTTSSAPIPNPYAPIPFPFWSTLTSVC